MKCSPKAGIMAVANMVAGIMVANLAAANMVAGIMVANLVAANTMVDIRAPSEKRMLENTLVSGVTMWWRMEGADVSAGAAGEEVGMGLEAPLITTTNK